MTWSLYNITVNVDLHEPITDENDYTDKANMMASAMHRVNPRHKRINLFLLHVRVWGVDRVDGVAVDALVQRLGVLAQELGGLRRRVERVPASSRRADAAVANPGRVVHELREHVAVLEADLVDVVLRDLGGVLRGLGGDDAVEPLLGDDVSITPAAVLSGRDVLLGHEVLGLEANVDVARRDRVLCDVVPTPAHDGDVADAVRALLFDRADDLARVVLDALARENVDDLVHLEVDVVPALEGIRVTVVEDGADVVRIQEHAAGGHRVDAMHARAYVADELSEGVGIIGVRLLDRGGADFVREVQQRRDLEGDREWGDGEHALEVERRPEHERGVRVGTRAVEAGDLGDELGAVAHALRVDKDVEEVGGEHAEHARGVLRRLRNALLRINLQIDLLEVE